MPLQFVAPRNKFLLPEVIDRQAVFEHMRLVLISFAMKPGFSQFYIGITNDLDRRLQEHQIHKSQFKFMVPIYQEQSVLSESAFDHLERDAIDKFRAGIVNPDTSKLMLRCANGPRGAPPKRMMYLLVG